MRPDPCGRARCKTSTSTVNFAVFEGASSGLLDESDLQDAASVIDSGSSAGVQFFEHRWATRFVQSLRRGEAQLVSAGYITRDASAAALDAVED